MRRILALTAALFALSLACDDPTGVLGPLDWGIIDGREQTATAGDTELPEPAVAQVWRDQNGQAFIGAAPLYAQTEVIGVVGAVVCVGEEAIEGEPITPHARCTATDVDGLATFHMTPPTTAGRHRTPIVAEVDGVALTPDTVTADVRAGAPDSGLLWNLCAGFAVSTDTLDLTPHPDRDPAMLDAFGNEIQWALVPFESSSLYTVRADSQAIIAAPDVSGIDSVQVFGGGELVRVSHVYVRHPEVQDPLVIWNWPESRNCDTSYVPAP